jgi:4,5:9,10-diseco-3-hydroxy-5,9,17-trioxoandrosta-1(10),2-diene-4-oate hydrolase
MLTLATSYAVADAPGRKDVDFAGRLRSATVARASVDYVDVGTGESIVLLHGIAGRWQNWIQNIPRLAVGHRVIALDFPGFGGSPLPRPRVTVSLYARVVEELCAKLDLGPVTLVGHSLGGLVAMEVAGRFPQRVKRAILVAPAGVSIGRPAHGMKIALRLALMQSPQVVRLLRRIHGPGRPQPIALVVEHPELFERGLLRTALLGRGPRPAFGLISLNVTELWARRRLLEHAPAIRCATLLVWGRQDRVVPVADAEVLGELIPGARTVLIDDAGHVPMLERPIEFNRLLLEFVRQ